MREIQVTIKLTDEQIDFLKQLIVNDKNEFEWEIDDYNVWGGLINNGIISEWYNLEGSYFLLTDIGVQIKNKLL